MLTRPQFSLRRLLLVSVMVCLAATTVRSLPSDRPLARNAQTVLSLALCVLGAAMLMAGTMSARRYSRTLLVGALFPALAPVVMVWVTLWHVEARNPGTFVPGTPPVADFLGRVSPLPRFFATCWAMIPCSSLMCLLWHWLLRHVVRCQAARMRRAHWTFALIMALAGLLWAFSPLFGLACAFFHWLSRRRCHFESRGGGSQLSPHSTSICGED